MHLQVNMYAFTGTFMYTCTYAHTHMPTYELCLCLCPWLCLSLCPCIYLCGQHLYIQPRGGSTDTFSVFECVHFFLLQASPTDHKMRDARCAYGTSMFKSPHAHAMCRSISKLFATSFIAPTCTCTLVIRHHSTRLLLLA